jgi:glyoxylase-like metal-dependent hydrolase (beta-lactamase superfamily II)
MKVHHLNCGTLKPFIMDIEAIVYCLVVDTGEGLVLVDTGFGISDFSQPSLKMRFFLTWMGVPRDPEECAINQIKRLGYSPAEVKDIIQTHLHIDHAGGLRDFPWARVHVFHKEHEAIQAPKGLMEFAYVKDHWAHQPDWVVHQSPQVDWYGLEAIPVLKKGGLEFLLIPLPGHTRGHCGVAIGKPGNWLFHCGDAASPFHQGSDLHQRGKSAYLLNFLPEKLANRILGGHVPRLRALLERHRDEIRAISSHDLYSYREYNLE